jgi:hypothetical protein
MTKNQVIETVISLMKDTDDPKNGAVFEKSVDVDFVTFCAFVLTQWDNVTMETQLENKSTVYLFYSSGEKTEHIASYILNFLPGMGKSCGFFGGSRIGSENKAWNDKGFAFVKNPFKARSQSAMVLK